MQRPLNILVVDDDRDNAQSLGELFELEGHHADVVYSGEAAVEAFARSSYDVAFMDVMLPGRNGVESFLEIKRMNPGARVYMMTGYSVEQLLYQAIGNGAMGVLTKPIDMAKVLAALRATSPCGIVLIAEDDRDFGPELHRLVTDGGYDAELVTNGRDAIDAVLTRPVEIMILDLKLPLIDGVGVYLALKQAGRVVPTIIITACAVDYAGQLHMLDDVSITGILSKPFDPTILLERLGKLAA